VISSHAILSNLEKNSANALIKACFRLSSNYKLTEVDTFDDKYISIWCCFFLILLWLEYI